ncbi:MAG: hypothetical protein SPF51_10020 [Candidatus Fimivicinus sp.]|nr:hypothetical protein [Candidatus Fimivicinus sp.]
MKIAAFLEREAALPVVYCFIKMHQNNNSSVMRAQAAQALPFPLGRKRKQKGPFRTAHRQRKDEATNHPVRRGAQKLAASRRSNNLCARF